MPVGTGPNPRVEQGVSFTVQDFAGAPTADTEIETMGSAFTGLDVGFRTEIVLPVPCTAVEATLVHLSQPAHLRGVRGRWRLGGVADHDGRPERGRDAAHHRERDRPRGDRRAADETLPAAFLLRAGLTDRGRARRPARPPDCPAPASC